MAYPIEETLEEPFESINARIKALFFKMLLELWQEFPHHFVMMMLKSQELWKTRDEKSMHSVFEIPHQLVQGPKHVLFFGEVHEKEGGNLGHALTVANFCIVHRIGG